MFHEICTNIHVCQKYIELFYFLQVIKKVDLCFQNAEKNKLDYDIRHTIYNYVYKYWNNDKVNQFALFFVFLPVPKLLFLMAWANINSLLTPSFVNCLFAYYLVLKHSLTASILHTKRS